MTADLFETAAIPAGPLGLLADVMLALSIVGVAAAGCGAVGWALRRTRQSMGARVTALLAQAVLAVGGGILALRAGGAPGWAVTAVQGVAAGVLSMTFLILVAAVRPALRAGRRRRRPDGDDQVTGAPHTGNHRSSSGSMGSSPASAA